MFTLRGKGTKFQFVALFKSAQPGNDYHCHCEARRAVAISGDNVE